MTSNLGTADLRKASVGFAKSSEAMTYEKMKEKVHGALKAHFRPEFLNRIDDVIVFHELTKDEVAEIIDLMIKGPQPTGGPGPRPGAHPGQVPRGREGLRPDHGRPSAASSVATAGRGSPLRNDPLEGVPGRRDHHRRRRGGCRARRAGDHATSPATFI